MKEIEKLVLCDYGVIMHLGNIGRIVEKLVKHSAFPRALSHHKRTRLVFYFLNIWLFMLAKESQNGICMDQR